MTQLQECINSGQVSAAQVVAHAEAGELAQLPEPRARLRWDAANAVYKVNRPNIDSTDIYSDSQMREYAQAHAAQYKAALEAEREKVRVLRGALVSIVGNPEDPNIGWLATSRISRDHFRCEFCGMEHLDCSKIEHATSCPVPNAIRVVAELTATQEPQA